MIQSQRIAKLAVAALVCIAAAFGSAYAAGPDLNKIYTVGDTVDVIPMFPGGNHLFQGYIDEHVDSTLVGSDQPVYVSFVVTPDYTINHSTIKALRKQEDGSLAPAPHPTPYEKSVIQLVRNLPGFCAAEKDGYYVYFNYILAINAELEAAPVLAEPVPPVRNVQTGPSEGATSAPTTLPMSQRAYEGERVYNGERMFTQWDRLQKRPEYPGGEKEMYRAVNSKLHRPHIYSHQKDIYVAFVIMKDGDIDESTIKCLRRHPDGKYVDAEQLTSWEEAMMAAVATLSGFEPAEADGLPVPYLQIIRFTFR